MYADSFITDMQKGIKEEICVRTYEKKKRIFINNFLIDVCIEMGYLFKSKYSRKSRQTLQLERIQKIYKDNKMMGISEITKKGKAINRYLFTLVCNNSSITIQRNNPVLHKLLFSEQ
ncbi:hypothetical protein EDI_002030 [Entamoeba dispar SAW760]|uniref:Uncharacterized protein n=1 Tax=Entamoeba dispar (strain ATCC PRA-260 / SAW760) TaxID=370354 RepID=B0EJ72_ENTDS|nr:uncharacterized protein EDI_002030 [Entamoeba dispar SAW760]EDR25380.1 hypothetical protein EDI_002030 [Entamoeba dispar SAW760]|eukprot:EDR25380.1 hypothetical protein EDI_002030 [Entamoeba dispar SAW760]